MAVKKFFRTEQEQTPVKRKAVKKKYITSSGENDYVISLVPIDELKLWDGNPWEHKKAIPKIAESLAFYGQVSPVIADRKTKVIYKGNHTYQAINYLHKHMRAISNKINMPVADIQKNIDTNYVKVEFKDFASEQAAIAYGIADNNLSKGGKYDPDTLVKIFNSDEDYFYNKPRNMAFTERDLKIYKDHRGNCNPRPRQYEPDDDEIITGDYLLLTFNTPEVGERLKDFLTLDGTDRKLNFERLYPYLNKKTKEFFDDVIDLPF